MIIARRKESTQSLGTAESEHRRKKALAGSVVGLLTGAIGLMMQGSSEGFRVQHCLNNSERPYLISVQCCTWERGIAEDPEQIDWGLAIREGMFSAAIAGIVWEYGGMERGGVEQ